MCVQKRSKIFSLTWLVRFEQQHEWHDVLKSTSISVSKKFVKIDFFLDSHPSISIWCSSSVPPIVWPITWLYDVIICTHTTHILNQSKITLFIRNQIENIKRSNYTNVGWFLLVKLVSANESKVCRWWCVGRIKIFFVFKNFWILLKSCSCQKYLSAVFFLTLSYITHVLLILWVIQYYSVMMTSSKDKTKWGHGYWWSYHEFVRTVGLEIKPLINLVVFCSKIDVFGPKQRFRERFRIKTHVIPSFMESKSFQTS